MTFGLSKFVAKSLTLNQTRAIQRDRKREHRKEILPCAIYFVVNTFLVIVLFLLVSGNYCIPLACLSVGKRRWLLGTSLSWYQTLMVVNTTSFVLEKDMHCSFHVCKFSELHGILVSLLGSVQTLASEFSELHV